MSDPKTGSHNQSHNHHAVFNIVACLKCLVPKVECLCDLGAKTDQQKQECTELKNTSPHFVVLTRGRFRERKGTHHRTILSSHEGNLKALCNSFQARGEFGTENS